MSHVSIIGGGNMGQAIATIVTRGGNTVEVFTSNDADKPVTGDVVFLAVPYPAVADVLAQRGDQLAGKVLVGVTKSPLNFETFDPLVVPADASTAARTASSPSRPRPRVLKAFNTNVAAPLAAGAVGERPTTVLSAGGDADATAVLMVRSPPAPSPAGMLGWHRAPDEGPSRWWCVGMFVLVLTLFALLTVLYRA